MTMNELESTILTKNSSENEIKTYFERILQLKQSSEEFPINLDEVWMLVYNHRHRAISSLKDNFIENEDFISLTQNGKQRGGQNKIDYKLSISCLEYFIARKVRPVFDVYRQVFHKVAEQKPLSQLQVLQKSVEVLIEHDKRLSSVEEEIKLIKAQTTTRANYFTILGYGALHGLQVNLTQACSLGRKASDLCKSRGLEMDECPDPRFGKVRLYPVSILNEVFSQPISQ